MGVDVLHLLRVALEVVELPLGCTGGIADQLVIFGSHAVVSGDVMVWVVVHPVAVVHGLAPYLRGASLQVGTEALAVHVLVASKTGEVHEGVGKVDVQDDVAVHRASLNLAGVAGEEGHA